MTERPNIKDCPPALRSLGVVGLSLFLTIISCLLPAASPLYSAEFEVVDRFSVNNYSEFRGSVTVKGSMLDVQNSAQFGSAAKSTFTASGSLNLAPGAALTFSAGAIGDGLIYGQDIADSTITLNKLNQNGCIGGEVIKWNGAAWSCGTDSGGSGEYVLKAGDAMTGQLTLNGSSLTVVNSLGADRYSLAVTTAADRSVYHLFVATTGNVGIGMAGPGSKLDVNGAITIESGCHPGWVTGAINIDSCSGSARIQAGAGGVYLPLLLNQNGGNVGIGTASPAFKLHVVGAGAPSSGGGGPGALFIGDNQGGNSGSVLMGYVNGASGYGWIQSYGALPLTINPLGNNVGIGTTGPGAMLHVAQNNGEIRLTRADVTGGIRLFEDSVGNFVYLQKRNDAGNWITMISGTEKQANSDVYLVQGGGNVGIGTTNVSYQLQLSQDSAAKPTSNTWTIASDRRVKKDIKPFTDGLDVIKQINPIRYRLNGKAGLPEGAEGISVVAQEAREAIPYAISTYKARLEPSDALETDIYNFNSSPLTFVLINAVKEQQKEIEELKMKVIELEKRSP